MFFKICALKNLQHSQENTYVVVPFNKVVGLAKFLRTHFINNTSGD